MSAAVDKAAWEKIAKGRAGVRWGSVVEKVSQDIGRSQQCILSTEKFGGYKTELKYRVEKREKLARRTKVKEEGRLEIYGGS